MIICDNCSYPTTEVVNRPVPTRYDPYGELHWCFDCAKAYENIYTKAKQHMQIQIMEEVDKEMKIFMKDMRSSFHESDKQA